MHGWNVSDEQGPKIKMYQFIIVLNIKQDDKFEDAKFFLPN